jgi:predicted transcriptional regulator
MDKEYGNQSQDVVVGDVEWSNLSTDKSLKKWRMTYAAK